MCTSCLALGDAELAVRLLLDVSPFAGGMSFKSSSYTVSDAVCDTV